VLTERSYRTLGDRYVPLLSHGVDGRRSARSTDGSDQDLAIQVEVMLLVVRCDAVTPWARSGPAEDWVDPSSPRAYAIYVAHSPLLATLSAHSPSIWDPYKKTVGRGAF